MKKDILSDWLKEFCMLVFIQTVQAFIFAIVMSLILSILSGDFGSSESEVASTSIIAVFLLASVSKIEDIIKKVFGVKSGFHDSGMRGGLRSLATFMMAGNIFKGVTDNVKKMTGGAAGVIGANKNIARQRARMARDLNIYGAPALNEKAPAKGTTSNLPLSDNTTSDDYMKKAIEAKNKGDMREYERNRGIAAGMKKASEPVAGVSSSKSGGDIAKLQDKMDAYDDKIRDLKTKRRQSAISMVSGGVETIGAAGGGLAGLAFGAALGETKEVIQGGMIGAGLGDKAGRLATQAVASPVNAAASVSNTIRDIGSIRQSNREFEKEMASFSASSKEIINSRDKQIRTMRQAKKQLNKALENINAGNMDM